MCAEGGEKLGSTEFVPVRALTHATLVPLARSILDGAGIRYFIRNERVQDLIGWGRLGPGYNIPAGAPLVTVEPSRADEAKELLADLVDPDSPDVEIGDAWKAPAVAEPTDSSVRLKASHWIAGFAIVLLILIGGQWAINSAWVRGIVLGSAVVILETDVESALWHELELGRARIAHLLNARGIPVGTIETESEPGIEISGIAPENMGDVESVLEELFPDWSRESTGPESWRVEMTPLIETRVFQQGLEEVRRGLREDLGATVVSVLETAPGSWQLRVRVSGTSDVAEARALFMTPAMLEIREVVAPELPGSPPARVEPHIPDILLEQFSGRFPDHVELVVERDSGGVLYWPVRKVAVIVGADLAGAAVQMDEWGDPVVWFRLHEEAGRRLEAATERLVGRQMALVLRTRDGAEVLSAPVIEGVIRDNGVVRGGFTLDQAKDVAARLRAGSRPLFLTPVESSTGED